MKRKLQLFYEVEKLSDPSIENAEALVRSYRNKLLRRCQKGEDYSCIALIGLFKSRATDQIVQVDSNGKKVYIPEDKKDIASNPEIHIVMLASPARTLVNETEKYFRKHNAEANSFGKDMDEIGFVLSHVMRNSACYRTVVHNPEMLPESQLAKLINVAECMNVTLGGKNPVFEIVSENRFKEVKRILKDAGLELISSTRCPKKEQIIRQSQIAQLFNIDFTTYKPSIK